MMTHPTTISTPRLTLRPFDLADLEGYVAYYTGPRTGGVGGPKPRYQVVERFMAMAGQWALRGYGRYAMDLNGTGIGHVGVMHVDAADPAELTWSLWDATHEGMGYATEAADAVMAAWDGAPLVARIAPDNHSSRRVAERLGMVVDETAIPPSYDANMITYKEPRP